MISVQKYQKIVIGEYVAYVSRNVIDGSGGIIEFVEGNTNKLLTKADYVIRNNTQEIVKFRGDLESFFDDTVLKEMESIGI